MVYDPAEMKNARQIFYEEGGLAGEDLMQLASCNNQSMLIID